MTAEEAIKTVIQTRKDYLLSVLPDVKKKADHVIPVGCPSVYGFPEKECILDSSNGRLTCIDCWNEPNDYGMKK